MRTEWVILADANRARIFARVGGAGWQDIRDLTRNGNGNGGNGRELRLPEGMRKLASVPVAANDDFLDRVGRELKAARKRGEFDALALVAPPLVLEVLVANLDPATRKVVTATAAENLVGLPVREARRELGRRF